MNYRVIVTPRAKNNLKTIHDYISHQAPQAAGDWLDRAEGAVFSLAYHPERCPLAPESLSFGKPIRQLLFGAGNRGTYRVLFVVADQSVYVLHVRHGSRLPLSPSDD
jgi:plasmid stabilization system protein ParE